MPPRAPCVIVVGAGIAGLAAAIDLARRGVSVSVVERAATPGGKMRQASLGTVRIDAGPTVLTLRRVFDDLFRDAGARLEDHLTLQPADILARHAWPDGTTLDLFADPARSADAIAEFAGPAAARGFLEFHRRARAMFTTLDASFMQARHPTPFSLLAAVGPRRLAGITPFVSLWSALGRHFADPRLRQLFARYATYSGASPFLAPATLMVIADAEQQGVWLVEGGMYRLADALARLAAGLGVDFRYSTEVAEVAIGRGGAAGVRLTGGAHLAADAVLLNTDAGAIGTGRLGEAIRHIMPAQPPARRSASALTWSMLADVPGFPLARHTVFFGPDYAAEFNAVFRHHRLPENPTVYICAQDRDDAGHRAAAGPERLFCLVNAPAAADTHPLSDAEISRCANRTFAQLAARGLRIMAPPELTQTTTPADFAEMFPGSGGALYGPAMHGPFAAFRRPAAATRIPGLYLAGGSIHPGPGVPMAALSGRMAARQLLEDLASTSLSRRTAMRGGTSMHSATTGGTASR